MRPKGTYAKKGKKDAKQRAWNSMRWLGTFTVPDIIATAETGFDNARAYIRKLERFGYVKRVKGWRSGYQGGDIVWRLAKNTGPLRPLERKDGTLYDPNRGEIVEALPHERSRLDSGAARRLQAKQSSEDREAPGPVGGGD